MQAKRQALGVDEANKKEESGQFRRGYWELYAVCLPEHFTVISFSIVSSLESSPKHRVP